MAIILVTERAAAIGESESKPKVSSSEGKAGDRKNVLLDCPKVNFHDLTKWKEERGEKVARRARPGIQ